MKIGKLSNELLNKIIIEPVKANNVSRKEVLIQPSIGEDCCALSFGDDMCILSTDPITGAVKDIGRLAVNINTNDIAAAGGEPIGIMVTALLPPDITEKEITHIMQDVYTTASELGIAVLGGHTEITDCVIKPVLSCTVVGKTKRFMSTGGCKVGDSLVMTKWAGLEGTAIIAKDFSDKLKVSRKSFEEAEQLSSYLSVIEEGKIASELEANAMHDVTEGGILGACWEMAKCSDTGVTVYMDSIPVLDCTREICDYIGINPLRLISSGSMLISTSEPEKLVNALKEKNIEATVIGKITHKDMLIESNGVVSVLEEPDCDQLYMVEKLLQSK